MTDAFVVRRETQIAAPPATVFAYLTDPQKILSWMGLEADTEAQPGGLYLVKGVGQRGRTARGRKKQVLGAIRAAADQLSNTPAICRKSYVHDTIVTAFEDGILERFAATMTGPRTQKKREQLLAQVVMAAAA